MQITYDLAGSSTSIDPFVIPNPGGADFNVQPTAAIVGGTMTVSFPSDDAGVIEDGVATITTFDFDGTTNLAFSNGLRLFGTFGPLIVANLGGPLTGILDAPSSGNLSGISMYSETTTGGFDTVGGPTTCSDNAGGLACGALSTLFGISFPLPAVPADDNPLAVSDSSFTDLNGATSTASNTLAFSLPIGGGASASLPIDFSWTETSRSLIPEPSAASLAILGLTGLLRRRRP